MKSKTISNNENIPFNQPFLTGNEIDYIRDAVMSGQISGNGKYTKLCQEFFVQRSVSSKCLLTSSCTDALEMSALLCNIQPGDEVIIPSYTFVSTANAFVLRGAKVVFADSRKDHPGLDEDTLEELITSRTKAIVPVHYAGVACDMDKIMNLAQKYDLLVVEDAAQAIDSYYKGIDGVSRALGSIGNFAAFSFHETKNIICGEGGMLAVNDEKYVKRAEIIWEKGTNRSAFFRGEVDKYSWVDIGSSFLPSEVTAAFLWSQLEKFDEIQSIRREIWKRYYKQLEQWAKDNEVALPVVPNYATNNAHMFYLVMPDSDSRTRLIQRLRNSKIHAVFHYVSLHNSPYYKAKHDKRPLRESDRYTRCLVRLPFYLELDTERQKQIIDCIKSATI